MFLNYIGLYVFSLIDSSRDNMNKASEYRCKCISLITLVSLEALAPCVHVPLDFSLPLQLLPDETLLLPSPAERKQFKYYFY